VYLVSEDELDFVLLLNLRIAMAYIGRPLVLLLFRLRISPQSSLSILYVYIY
jgi:hypothetical protein